MFSSTERAICPWKHAGSRACYRTGLPHNVHESFCDTRESLIPVIDPRNTIQTSVIRPWIFYLLFTWVSSRVNTFSPSPFTLSLSLSLSLPLSLFRSRSLSLSLSLSLSFFLRRHENNRDCTEHVDDYFFESRIPTAARATIGFQTPGGRLWIKTLATRVSCELRSIPCILEKRRWFR